jgi:hypothetical protein
MFTEPKYSLVIHGEAIFGLMFHGRFVTFKQ